MDIPINSIEFKEIEKIAIDYINSKEDYYAKCIFFLEKDVTSTIKGENNIKFDFEGIYSMNKNPDFYYSICKQLGEKPEYVTYIVELDRDYENHELQAIIMSKWIPPSEGSVNDISEVYSIGYDIDS